MEKSFIKRTVIKTVEEEIETQVYVSKDGTIFDNDTECLDWEEIVDFRTYFDHQYKVENIDPVEFGLNLGNVSLCQLIYVKKISDEVLNDFTKYYNLEDHPYDLIEIKEGWSFIALIEPENFWEFNTRKLILITLEDVIKGKRKELNLLTSKLKKLTK